MDKEIWEDIEGYEGLYQVSNLGRVKSLDRYVKARSHSKEFKKGKILKPRISQKGYLTVLLCKDNIGKEYRIHRLVALAFIPNPENKLEVNHIDGKKQNNCVDNLEWNTRSENIKHAFAHDLKKIRNSENSHLSKLTKVQVAQIRKEYIPYDKNFSTYALAQRYGVSAGTINSIVHNKTYKDTD